MAEMTRLEGVIVALATPITEDERVDEAKMSELVHHVMDGGVNGLFVMGSSGEFAAFTDEEWERSIKIVAKENSENLPLLVGAMDTGTARVIQKIDKARDLGADVAVVTPCYYYPLPMPESIMIHYSEIANRASLPILMYNHPDTGALIGIEEVRKLKEHPRILGIKDSGVDFVRFQKLRHLCKDSKDFTLIQGEEPLVTVSLLYGAQGCITGLSNVAPKLHVEIYKAAKERAIDRCWELNERMMRIFSILEEPGGGVTASSYIKGLKIALKLLGLGNGRVTRPFPQVQQSEVRRIEKILKENSLT